MEENLPLQIDWTSLIVRSKFTVFALFYFVFEGNFLSKSSQGGLYLEFYGISTEGCTNYTRSNPLLNKL